MNSVLSDERVLFEVVFVDPIGLNFIIQILGFRMSRASLWYPAYIIVLRLISCLSPYLLPRSCPDKATNNQLWDISG